MSFQMACLVMGLPLRPGKEKRSLGLRFLQIELYHFPRVVPDGHDPLLRALAGGDHEARVEVDVALLEGSQLRDAQARRIEELQDGAVPDGQLLIWPAASGASPSLPRSGPWGWGT